MDQAIKYIFNNRLPSLNKYTSALNSNRYIGAKMKKEAEELLLWQIIAQGKKQASGKVDILITWYVKNKKEDKDNIVFAKKFILDALQKAEVIKGDSWKYLNTITDIVLISGEAGRVSDYSVEVILSPSGDHFKTIIKHINKLIKS